MGPDDQAETTAPQPAPFLDTVEVAPALDGDGGRWGHLALQTVTGVAFDMTMNLEAIEALRDRLGHLAEFVRSGARMPPPRLSDREQVLLLNLMTSRLLGSRPEEAWLIDKALCRLAVLEDVATAADWWWSEEHGLFGGAALVTQLERAGFRGETPDGATRDRLSTEPKREVLGWGMGGSTGSAGEAPDGGPGSGG